jgi:hypothetical protein
MLYQLHTTRHLIFLTTQYRLKHVHSNTYRLSHKARLTRQSSLIAIASSTTHAHSPPLSLPFSRTQLFTEWIIFVNLQPFVIAICIIISTI